MIGIDLAKNVIQVNAVNEFTCKEMKRCMMRKK